MNGSSAWVFGSLAAVKTLRDAGILVNSTIGLRTGLVIVDHEGYFLLRRLFIWRGRIAMESAPNAMRLSKDQVTEDARAPLTSGEGHCHRICENRGRERPHSRSRPLRSPRLPYLTGISRPSSASWSKALGSDIARQVRVFSAYVQYVELKLSGAAIQRHRLAIPSSIQKLDVSKDLEARLRTTFDLIESGGKLSSKALEDTPNEIRKITPSPGNGRPCGAEVG